MLAARYKVFTMNPKGRGLRALALWLRIFRDLQYFFMNSGAAPSKQERSQLSGSIFGQRH